MRAAASIVLTAACASDAPLLLGPELLIDVQVEPAWVRIYVSSPPELNNGDIVGGDHGGDGNAVFPNPGSCVVRDDTSGSGPSCFTEITVDGIDQEELSFGPHAEVKVRVHEGSVLTLKGCRTHETRIPLHASEFPATQIAVANLGDLHSVSWRNDPSANSTIVAGVVRDGLRVCHVPRDVRSHTFEVPPERKAWFYVEPMLPLQTTVNELGTIRVWRGDRFVPR